MMTWAEFLMEQDKIVNFDLPKAGEKRGGAQQSSARLVAKGQVKAVNPARPPGLVIPSTPWKDHKLKTLIMGDK
jgi:hypothetical protein